MKEQINTEIAAGYKMTELGPLPQEWEVVRLGEVVKNIISGDWGSNEKSNDNLIQCYVLRGTDFKKCEDKIINDVPIRFVLKNSLEKRKLKAGDILIELSGGGPGQPTGRIFFVTEDFIKKIGENVIFSNFVKKLIADENVIIPEYFYRYWQFLYQKGKTLVYEKRTTGIRNFKYNDFLKQENILIPQLEEQRKIAVILSTVQKAIEIEKTLIERTKELKKAMMHKLFTEGIPRQARNGARSERQKMTEIGPIPESWEVVRLGNNFSIKSSAITYGKLIKMNDKNDKNYGLKVLGIKVSDMNIDGNEKYIKTSNLIKNIDYTFADKLIPENAIIFPKRGAAIATNKKRLSKTKVVLDPNLIALIPNEKVISEYFYYWFLTFDLSKITEPGPTPQLNKKNLAPVVFPLPPKEIQEEIADIMLSIDKKIALHTTKKKKNEEFFRTLLHQLMSAKIRVNNIDLRFIEGVEQCQ